MSKTVRAVEDLHTFKVLVSAVLCMFASHASANAQEATVVGILNGKSLRFAIASTSLNSYVRASVWTPSEDEESIIAVGGSKISANLRPLADSEMDTRHGSEVDGALGIDALNQVVVGVDLSSRTATLWSREVAPSIATWFSGLKPWPGMASANHIIISIQRLNGLPIVKALVGEEASKLVFSTRYARVQLIAHKGVGYGSPIDALGTNVLVIPNIRIDELAMPINIVEVGVKPRVIGAGQAPDGFIGLSGFLARFIYLDLGRNLIAVDHVGDQGAKSIILSAALGIPVYGDGEGIRIGPVSGGNRLWPLTDYEGYSILTVGGNDASSLWRSLRGTAHESAAALSKVLTMSRSEYEIVIRTPFVGKMTLKVPKRR